MAADCHHLRLQPVPPQLFPQGEWALSRGAQTWRRTQRSVGREGPAWPTQSRREAGRGGGEREGRGRSVAGYRASSTAASPPPSPPQAQPAPPPPQSAPTPPRGRLQEPQSLWLESSPAPPPLWLGVLPPKLSLASSQAPAPETAAYPCTPPVPRPSPQTPALNSLLEFGQRDAPLFVPGPGHGGWLGA